MKFRMAGLFLFLLFATTGLASATERNFTYTYEPETMPQGAREIEQWVTFRGPRNAASGFDRFSEWDSREEIEYGVNDNYTMALVIDNTWQRYRETDSDHKVDNLSFDGLGLENKIAIVEPSEGKVGVSLYLEPKVSNHEVELEDKIILGQRIGDWKWAFDVTHETSWEDDETNGDLEFTFGLIKNLNPRWSVGVELRDDNDLPEYKKWADTAFFAGPVVNYRRENWWVTLTALGQVYGRNAGEDADGRSGFELSSHEYVNVRCIVGISF